jgi:hypothetical protein
MTIELSRVLVILPDTERRVYVDCEFTPAWGGNRDEQPEGAEVSDITTAIDADSEDELSEDEIQALFDNDVYYEVLVAAAELAYNTRPDEDDMFDDSMDGDFDSAMASAGHGTNEDYGDFGGGDDF